MNFGKCITMLGKRKPYILVLHLYIELKSFVKTCLEKNCSVSVFELIMIIGTYNSSYDMLCSTFAM